MTSRFAKLMWPGLVILVTKSMGQLSLDQEGYCNIHQNHTLCLFQDSVSDTCGQVVERGLSQDEKVLVTRLHNERRSFIARGLELRGDPGPQPPAANMMQLVSSHSTSQPAHHFLINRSPRPMTKSLASKLRLGQISASGITSVQTVDGCPDFLSVKTSFGTDTLSDPGRSLSKAGTTKWPTLTAPLSFLFSKFARAVNKTPNDWPLFALQCDTRSLGGSLYSDDLVTNDQGWVWQVVCSAARQKVCSSTH